jgi:hypothetical protein
VIASSASRVRPGRRLRPCRSRCGGRCSARSFICWTSRSRPLRTFPPRRPFARRLRAAPARRRRDHLVHPHRARGPGSHQRAAREPRHLTSRRPQKSPSLTGTDRRPHENSSPGVLPALAWRRRAPDCIVPPEQLLPPRACTAPHVMPLWPAVEVQETDTGADDASARSPRTAHTSQSDRMKPAMQAAERPRICGGSGGSGGGYRNSPEMRLTEPATMTTPNT